MQSSVPAPTNALPGWFRALIVLVGSALGTLMPLAYQAAAYVPLYVGYAACRRRGWPRYQLFLAMLIGGLGFGAGLQLCVGFAVHGRTLPSLLSPLACWLVLRMVFMVFEERYALIKPERAAPEHAGPRGTSAWSGDGEGATPDGSVRYRFFCTGEIAMGGPTYGDVVFSNGVALRNVGPSIALGDDGRFAAVTLPSRGAWGLWLVDLTERRVADVSGRCAVWEVDRIADGKLYGRVSPLVRDTPRAADIASLLAEAPAVALCEDDGFYFHPAQHEEPLPSHAVLAWASSTGAHVAELVPDTRGFADNPFLRLDPPRYQLRVDGSDLAREEREMRAVDVTWLDAELEGRFLVVGAQVFDFAPGPVHTFDVAGAARFALGGFDASTYVHWEGGRGTRSGRYVASALALPYHLDDEGGAEQPLGGYWHPSDTEQVQYWDARGLGLRERREGFCRHYTYLVDLAALSRHGDLSAATTVELPNRARPEHTARFELAERDALGGYAAYRVITSAGLDPGLVTHEARWSACGRFLAVVRYAAPPGVPGQLSILDFEGGTLRDLPHSYAFPSLAWFDAHKLELVHVVGLTESITRGPGRAEERVIRRGSGGEGDYALLVSGLPAREARVCEEAAAYAEAGGYASGTVQRLLQRCVLFAPEFAVPVLQPPR